MNTNAGTPTAAAAADLYERRLHGFRRGGEAARWMVKRTLWNFQVRSLFVLKRAIDLVGATFAICALTPVFVATALAIKLEDRGPVLFRQRRVGLHGGCFDMFKFRSMVVDAERRLAELAAKNESGAGVIFKMRQDPRITRVGRFIRRYSIDELPQFFNVLRGEMSLVGPRPALPKEVAQYSQEERVRLAIAPGITCLWQIGGRSEIDFHGQVRLDLDYLRSQSARSDLAILLKTVPVVLLGKGAY